MKNLIVKTGVLAVAVIAIVIGGAPGAAAADRALKVPFPFIVGDVQLPAGDYVVKTLTDGSGTIEITSTDGRRWAFALTIPSSSEKSTTDAELVFEKYNDRYFLARVAPEDGGERELILRPPTMQREIVHTRERLAN